MPGGVQRTITGHCQTERCIKFSRRARRYMGAYLAIKEDLKGIADGGSEAEAVAIDLLTILGPGSPEAKLFQMQNHSWTVEV